MNLYDLIIAKKLSGGGGGGGGDFSIANVTINLSNSEGINGQAVHIETDMMDVPIEIYPDANYYQVVMYQGNGYVTAFEPAVPTSNCTVSGNAQIIASPFNTVVAVRVTGDCVINIVGS